ncbi:MAG: alpha-glucosidase/alpha-galactosidase, partial [Planctomycetes bacterium]|nr:alpha-glucosidase/alpha-galactosidase [Planctomycetota bacterium]
MSKKIAMIGSGSLVFCKTLVADILTTPALQDSHICLMNRTMPKLERIAGFVQRMITDSKLPAIVSSTTDRRKALDGADFVIVMIQVGGLSAFQHDYEIPLSFGVDQCIGDSLGPGGVFRGLRTIPVLLDIAKDMRELSAPGAIMLNYANPMGLVCSGLCLGAEVPFVGLCHGVQTTLDLISRYVNVPKEHIDH